MDNSSEMLQLCRLCLVKDDVNIPIFEEQGDIRKIFLKISSCLPVKVSREDKLPKKICDGCSYKLDMLYEFWNKTANAEKQLLSWLGEAGMSSKMTDDTISAVAQQIKPTETFVKQEEIDPSDIHTEVNDDDKSYMFQQKFTVEEPGPSATVTSNEDEPPPKRARRTAAVKAQIAMDPESDDDDDSGEPMTKMEDESEDSDGEDREPAFVDVPSTSADDQPGPSGVGKDGVEAPPNIIGLHPKVRLRRVIFMCKTCRKSFSTIARLRRHMRNVKVDITYFCPPCDGYFQSDHPCNLSAKRCAHCKQLIDENNLRGHLCFHELADADNSEVNVSMVEQNSSKNIVDMGKKMQNNVCGRNAYLCKFCGIQIELSDSAAHSSHCLQNKREDRKSVVKVTNDALDKYEAVCKYCRKPLSGTEDARHICPTKQFIDRHLEKEQLEYLVEDRYVCKICDNQVKASEVVAHISLCLKNAREIQAVHDTNLKDDGITFCDELDEKALYLHNVPTCKYCLMPLADMEQAIHVCHTKQVKTHLENKHLEYVVDDIYLCKICNSQFLASEVAAHLTQCLQNKGKELINKPRKVIEKKLINPSKEVACMCGKLFDSIVQLRTHMDGIEPCVIYFCKVCVMFCSKDIHEEPTCKNKNKLFQYCVICKNALFMEKLEDHLCFHTATAEEKSDQRRSMLTDFDNFLYLCHLCGKQLPASFQHAHNSAFHRRATLPKKIIKSCKICGYLYRGIVEYRHHRRLCEFLCHICGKKQQSDKIYSHIDSHSNTRRYKCTKCVRRFSFKHSLQRHMIVHANVAKYLCTTCGKRFKIKYNLKVHMRIHADVKPFECVVCKRTFTTKQWRDKHLRTHSVTT